MTLWLMVIAGFALLMFGGDMLVSGSVEAARKMGVSPLIIGLTLVGCGTSMPELVTSVQATWAGSPGIAFGNIVGSNISNTLLIIGLSALVLPVAVDRVSLYRDGGAVLFATLLFIILALSTTFASLVGASLIALLATYLITVWLQDRRSTRADISAGLIQAEEADILSVLKSIALATLGMAIVVGGGYLLVEGAIGIARTYAISEAIIGLTIVAIGTSLPELVTSMIAAFRGQSDLAVGNILGSNLFNLLGIGGATALMAPNPIAVPGHIAHVDNFVMLAAIAALLVMAWTSKRITRAEGGVLFLAYVGYMGFLILPEIKAL